MASSPELDRAGIREVILPAFREEVADLLTSLDSHLTALDQDPAKREILSEVVRIFHTIKGAFALVDFDSGARLAYAFEREFRTLAEQGEPSPKAVLRMAARAAELLAAVTHGLRESDHDLEAMNALLQELHGVAPATDSHG
jgi:chemotaxis protein histidine kinase CheA